MSADNMAICPKCSRQAKAARKELTERFETAYGKVSEEEYLRLKEEVKKPLNSDFTLAEYYEIGIYGDSDFFIRYKSTCDVCGFEFEFKHKEKVL